MNASASLPPANQSSALPGASHVTGGGLRLTWFDRVTSMLTALMALIGTVVMVLFLLWALSPAQDASTIDVPPRVVAGVASQSETDADFLTPESNEVVDLAMPTMQESITAITDATSTVAASERVETSGDGAISDGQRRSDADQRVAGPPGDADVVPRYQRWVLQFEAKTVGAYAEQLEHFGIELGMTPAAASSPAQQPGPVRILRDLTSPVPTILDLPTGRKPRLYFTWTGASPLERFDRQLFQSAGSPTTGRQMLKFVPAELENRLAVLELEYARSQGKDQVESIAKTVFDCIASSSGDHQFVVTSQRYRK